VAPTHPQRLLPALALAVALVHPTAAGAQLSARVTGKLDVASEYLDRGVILTNQPVLQPSLSIGVGLSVIGYQLSDPGPSPR
jgi:hypothetical protein